MSNDKAIERQAAFLKHVPLLHGFDDRLLQLLAQIMTLTRKPVGDVLCSQGDPGDACFIIGHGKVEVFTGEADDKRVLCTLGPGQVVGEVALIDGKKRSASVVCRTDVSVFTLKRDDFERLLYAGNHASMRLLDNITQSLASRVRNVNNRYAEIFSQAGETITELSQKLSQLQAQIQSDSEGADIDDDLLALVNYQER